MQNHDVTIYITTQTNTKQMKKSWKAKVKSQSRAPSVKSQKKKVKSQKSKAGPPRPRKNERKRERKRERIRERNTKCTPAAKLQPLISRRHAQTKLNDFPVGRNKHTASQRRREPGQTRTHEEGTFCKTRTYEEGTSRKKTRINEEGTSRKTKTNEEGTSRKTRSCCAGAPEVRRTRQTPQPEVQENTGQAGRQANQIRGEDQPTWQKTTQPSRSRVYNLINNGVQIHHHTSSAVV